jgi:anti-sigma B factor antagonist
MDDGCSAASPEASDPDRFSIVIESSRPGRAFVHVSGELDLATAPAFADEVSARLVRPIDTICVDLGRLSFIDSSGLRALHEIRTRADEQGVRLLLMSVPAQMRRVLELTNMTELFEYAVVGACGSPR